MSSRQKEKRGFQVRRDGRPGARVLRRYWKLYWVDELSDGVHMERECQGLSTEP